MDALHRVLDVPFGQNEGVVLAMDLALPPDAPDERHFPAVLWLHGPARSAAVRIPPLAICPTLHSSLACTYRRPVTGTQRTHTPPGGKVTRRASGRVKVGSGRLRAPRRGAHYRLT